MSDPLTTEDLYGPSKPEDVKSPAVEQKPSVDTPLVYEETPIITNVNAESGILNTDKAAVQQETGDKGQEASTRRETSVDHATSSQEKREGPPRLGPVHELPRAPAPPPMKSGSTSHALRTMLAFVLLIVAGVLLSGSLRQYIPSDIGESIGVPRRQATLTPTPTVLDLAGDVSSTGSAWRSYGIASSATKNPVDGVTISLPPDVLSPICDGVGCASQGTYLPGGTRLTIAPRGTGHVLKDFRGAMISDVNGVTFTTKKVMLLGREVTDFTGVFTGRTVSGYAFSKMRGVMIPLTDTTSLEINHFTPSGITADFAGDDILFDEIVSKLKIPGAGVQKGSVLVSPTPTQ